MKAPLELVHPKLIKSHLISTDKSKSQSCITLREWRPGKEWITNLHDLQSGGYYYGRYFKTLSEAEANFRQRVLEFGGKP